MTLPHRSPLAWIASLAMSLTLIVTGALKLVDANGAGSQGFLHACLGCVEVAFGIWAICRDSIWPALFAVCLALGGLIMVSLGVEDCGCAGSHVTRSGPHLVLAGFLGLSGVLAMRWQGWTVLPVAWWRRTEPAKD